MDVYMNDKLYSELDKLIEIGNGKNMIHTSTVVQLLNDLNRNTEEEYENAINYLEDRELDWMLMILKENLFRFK